MKKRKLKKAAIFEFPPEVIAGGTSVSVYEGAGCSIENYGELLTYTSEVLRVETHRGILRLQGEHFCIAEMMTDTLLMTGNIHSFEYEKHEGI